MASDWSTCFSAFAGARLFRAGHFGAAMPELITRAIEFRAADSAGDTIPCIISTEAPVDRGDYIEVLSHRASDVDLSRAPLPLIVQHNSDALNIGLVDNLRIEGGKLRGDARFGRSEQAQSILADVKAGIVRNLSVGYQLVRALSETGRTKRFAWAPFETSVVSVPADAGAGFYRSLERNDTMEQNNENLSRSQRRAMNANSDVEHNRMAEIIAIGRQYNCSDLAAEFAETGQSVSAFQNAIIERQSNQPLNTSGLARAGIGMSKREVQRFSIMRAIRAMSDPSARDEAAFEIECSRAVEQKTGRRSRGLFIPADVLHRDLTVGTASQGGYTVATDLLAANFIDVMRNRSEVMNMGASILSGLVGNVAIPRKTSGSTAYWVAEGGSATESSLAFDQVTMTPKSVTAYVDLTRKLLLQSSMDIELLVRNDLAGSLATAIDLAAINGSGASNQPTGILNTAGIGSVVGGTNGLAPTWAHIVDLESAVSVANADVGSLGYITNAKVRGKLLKTEKATSTAQFVWADGDRPLRGYRAGVSEQMPSNLTKGTSTGVCSAILFGNFADLMVGLWGGLDLMVDPYTLGSSGGVRVVAFQDVDIAVRHAESFAAMKDALTT